MYKKDLNNGNYLKSRLSKAGIWNEIVTLARINDWKFSRVQFTNSHEPSVEELLSDEFMIFHQGNHESNSITSICHHGIRNYFAGENLMQNEMVQDSNRSVLSLPENIEPAYLLLENSSNEQINSLSIRSGGRPFYHLDEFLDYLTTGLADFTGSSELDRVLAVQENFRKISCHGARLFHQVKDPLATNILAYANYYCESSCGVLARTFALCCTALGFKVRVWRLASHTLTEIFIADKFIIVDGDPLAKSYYLDPNNDSQLLGVEDMWGFTEEEFIELNILSKPIKKNIKKKQVKNNI